MKTLALLLPILAIVSSACDRESELEDENEGKTKEGTVDPTIVNGPPCGPVTTSRPVGGGFAPQTRIGCTVGDQWEPAIAADRFGHVYILETQYSGVPGCPSCSSPTVLLTTSGDRGDTFDVARPIVVDSTGQWDPQVVVDPVDGRTVYAAWMQNVKSDIVVARSTDFGATWTVVVANHTNSPTDKPILAVRGGDVYIAYNHANKAWVSSSHDAGATWSSVSLTTGRYGWSLPIAGTVTPSGGVHFSWSGFTQNGGAKGPVNLYVTSSTNGGRAWTIAQLDTSAATPECPEYLCGWAYLAAQMVITSDDAGALYALWNAGSVDRGPERIYFATRAPGASTWTPRVEVSTAPAGTDHAFPAIVAAVTGDLYVAWMDARAASGGAQVWNVYARRSRDGGASWSDEQRVSSAADGVSYVHPEGFDFPFGDYFEIDADERGTLHAAWGEGANYDSPGSVWYSRR